MSKRNKPKAPSGCYLIRPVRPGDTGLVRDGDQFRRVSSDEFAIFDNPPFDPKHAPKEYQVIACGSRAEAEKMSKDLAPSLPTAVAASRKNKEAAQKKIAGMMAPKAEAKAEAPTPPAPKPVGLEDAAELG